MPPEPGFTDFLQEPHSEATRARGGGASLLDMRPARVIPSFPPLRRGGSRWRLSGLLIAALAACGEAPGSAASSADSPASSAESPAAHFTAEDRVAVRALEEAYRTAWLANDSAAVMATLASDGVLMPAGVEPLAGDSAIRAYWWPEDGSRTTITRYDIELDEVEGSGDVAWVRGRGILEFTYVDPAGEESELTSEAAHLSIARRGEDGRWRIVRRAWSRLR